ncbi:response regulator [Tropicimonas sp. TH_r6]|uniref:response regulator n=1 Tax=Tropicimonas sp. TH_r6 TaxID=3082085 RepID=UPI002954C2E8|nr:response regulator [Tropicimonas sp. TH_r6]MDV7142124.1 response regulator [Tropicimonas sp. TH_r6]
MSDISVLIVEDDEKIGELHRRFTERVDGFAVVGIASTLADASEMITLLEPDLVLLDLYFPEGESFGLLKEIRAQGLETDVILITAAREVKALKTAMRNGVFDFIIKPLTSGRFADCLANYRRYRARVEDRSTLEQDEVDGILHPPVSAETGPDHASRRLPKGVDMLTLETVRAVFVEDGTAPSFSAEEVGARIGVSRSTARRYLEYLVSVRFVRPDLVYGSVGRPERRYSRMGPFQ